MQNQDLASGQPVASGPLPHGLASSIYADLRQSVVAAGLLKRAYPYYALRGLSCLVFLAVAFGFPFLFPTLPGRSVISAVLIGFSLVQVALLGHDAGHLAVFQGLRANSVLGAACFSFIAGIGFWYWRDRHNQHHAHTNDEEDDPDLYGAGLVAFNEEQARRRRGWQRWVTRYQIVAYPLLFPLAAFGLRLEGWRYAIGQLHGSRRWIELALLSANIAVWAAIVVLAGWHWGLIFIGSQLAAGVYLSLVVAPNHKAMPMWARGVQISFLERQVLSSRNILPHPVWDFLFGGLNYQIEHHLFPNMPRVNLGRARVMVKPLCEKIGLPYIETDPITSYRIVLVELARIGRTCRTAPAVVRVSVD